MLQNNDLDDRARNLRINTILDGGHLYRIQAILTHGTRHKIPSNSTVCPTRRRNYALLVRRTFLFEQGKARIMRSTLPLTNDFRASISIFRRGILSVILFITKRRRAILALTNSIRRTSVLSTTTININIPIINHRRSELHTTPPTLNGTTNLSRSIKRTRIPRATTIASLSKRTPINSNSSTIVRRGVLGIYRTLHTSLSHDANENRHAIKSSSVLNQTMLIVTHHNLRTSTIIYTLSVTTSSPRINKIVQVSTIKINTIRQIRRPSINSRRVITSNEIRHPRQEILRHRVVRQSITTILRVRRNKAKMRLTIRMMATCPLRGNVRITIRYTLAHSKRIIHVLNISGNMNQLYRQTIRHLYTKGDHREDVITVKIRVNKSVKIYFRGDSLFRVRLCITFRLSEAKVMNVATLRCGTTTTYYITNVGNDLSYDNVVNYTVTSDTVLNS